MVCVAGGIDVGEQMDHVATDDPIVETCGCGGQVRKGAKTEIGCVRC